MLFLSCSLFSTHMTCSPLDRYLRLYGRKFSKEDHVLFIKLLYELVTIPNLEISMMQSFARLLVNLLKYVKLTIVIIERKPQTMTNPGSIQYNQISRICD